MSLDSENETFAIMEYAKTASLKGSVEIGEFDFWWNLGSIFLHFMIDDGETTVCYSRRKTQFFDLGHFHEDNNNVINLIRDINSENRRVHITFMLGCSWFSIENKADKKKKSWLFVRHYYSAL